MVEAMKQSFPEELKVQNVPLGLFTEVINTVPFPPRYVKATFYANGILHPKSYGGQEEEDRQRYLDECEQQGVIPFITLNFEYDERNQLFVPKDTKTKKLQSSNEINPLFKGGKIYELEFRARSNEFTESMFPEFRRNLENLSGEGYQMMDANLALTVYRQGGYEEGTYGDTEIYLSTLMNPVERQFRVKFGRRNTSDGLRQKILQWAEGLREKHS